MAKTVYKKQQNNNEGRLVAWPVYILMSILPEKGIFAVISPIIGSSFGIQLIILFGLLFGLGPYAIAFLFIMKLNFFPFPLIGAVILVGQTMFLIYCMVIRRYKMSSLGREEKRFEKKMMRKYLKERKKFDAEYYAHGLVGGGTTKVFDKYRIGAFDSDLKESDNYETMLGDAISPVVPRDVPGITEPSNTPVIANYRAQVRYVHRPNEYRVYYTDTYSPEDAEKCIRKFLNDTKDDIITDCKDEGGLTSVTGMEHEIYIDFFSGNSLHVVRCYVAEGTVNYDYDYCETE